MKEKFDFDQFSKDLVESVKNGKPLTGVDGVFTPLIKMVLEASLESEITEHVKDTKPVRNRRNGSGTKQMESSLGSFELRTPRDRNGSFEPQTVGKRQVTLSSDIDKKILGLYGLGMSYSDIQSHLRELYDFEISDGTISSITDRIIPEIKEWQNRPLESVYPILWLDAMHYKVREDGQVKSKAVYSVLSVTMDGTK